ncbi:TlpA family protein disulfide reductase [Aquiluna sp. Uisw_065]|jgi:thiol-disulfide isomerase/thioredoxin|uniref:TlpA family protein disulfide reductase n=1 Tax=Aquiluna sp. Uisw_065 TaxID=3230967 RepID=UPI0039EC3086
MNLRTILRTAIGFGLIATLLAGCASDPLADQFRAGDNKNYIAGDGTVTEFALGSRPGFEAFAGLTESGQVLDSSAFEGNVIVMNWWYSACAPCRAEAGDLAMLSVEFEDSVQFVGVNVRDTAETALAFDRNFGIEYPSLIDAQSGQVSLAFTGVVSPQAVPTTIVIDRDGKVASRILGRIEASILRTLIQTVVDQ